MIQHYHHGLVLLSLLVAMLASYTALTLAMRIRLAAGVAAWAWLAGGGFAMGVGIWAMHFVGMLALTLPIQIAYDVWITLASMAIAVVVSTFALRIASRVQVTRRTLIAAGIAMGIGICSMHYVGMAAIEIAPPIRYDPLWVSASFAIAIAASFRRAVGSLHLARGHAVVALPQGAGGDRDGLRHHRHALRRHGGGGFPARRQ